MISIRTKSTTGVSRLYQFDSFPVRIGFRSEAHIPLEPEDPNGAEIVLLRDPSGTLLVQSTRDAGKFKLNGRAITTAMLVEVAKDAVTCGEYRIVIEQYIDPEEQRRKEAREEAERNRQDQVKQAREKELAARKNTSGAKQGHWLITFFEPVRAYLEDPEVSEVLINGPDQIYIERKGKLSKCPEKFASEQALQAAVLNTARQVGRLLNWENPRLDARLPDGSRVHAVIPPLTRKGTVVAIRKFSKDKLTIEQLIKYGSITDDGAKLLELVVKLHKNIIVSGATSSGKTSVLNVLSSFIGKEERILVLEDSSELQLQQEHVVQFETRKADEHGKGEVPIRDLVHSSLRLRPDRLVIGEIRGGEALDLLQAMNTGHDGSMSTIHANTPRDSLSRMETCALLGGVDIPLSALREQVGAAIHVVVQTARLFDGTRKITHITEIMGVEQGLYKLQDLYLFKPERLGEDGKLIGQHAFVGNKPTFAMEAARMGWSIPGLC